MSSWVGVSKNNLPSVILHKKFQKVLTCRMLGWPLTVLIKIKMLLGGWNITWKLFVWLTVWTKFTHFWMHQVPMSEVYKK